MRWLHFSFAGWSFAKRLLLLALAPAFLMLVIVNASLYLMSLEEAQADIRDRGRLIAAALAEGARYGVISGNVAAVDDTVKGLMQADPSIVRVEVLGADRRPLLTNQRSANSGNVVTTEAGITAGSLDVDLLGLLPPAAGNAERAADATGRPLAGYVRVTMSSAEILRAKRWRLLQGSLLVLFACAVSAAVGLALARRLRQPLDLVMGALRQIRQGRFDVSIEPAAKGELGELQRAIADMAKALGTTHQQLEDEVARRTADLNAAIQAVQAADADRRRLIARENALVEEERRRLSLEIHDELNAALIAVRLQADSLAAKARAEGDDETRSAAARISTLSDDLYRRARAIVTQLRPELIDTLGLAGAIEELVRRFNEVNSGCRFEFEVRGRLPELAEPVAIASFRAVQEAMSNVAKHAQASRCRVVVSGVENDGRPGLELRVEDNGRGFDVERAPVAGVGLIGMRERIAGLGGRLMIASSPETGTRVEIEISLGAQPGART